MNSKFLPRSAADAVRQSLPPSGSLFEKLLDIASARDSQNNRYADPVLALEFGGIEIDAAFRQQHRKAFAAWLALTLEQQHAELLNYLEDRQKPQALLQHWMQPQSYERLIPRDAMALERNLFVSDFEIVAALVEAT